MNYIYWIGLMLYGIIVIGSMITVLLDRRQPAKTMAWMMVLIFLPVLGIVLYFFFGQNTRKERIISQQSLDQLTKRSMLEYNEQRELTFPDQYLSLITLFMNQNLALPFQSDQTEIYTDGYEFFPALLQAIAQARHHIHLNTYIIEDDPLGYLVADALIDKAREGVEVRLIYDDVGCWKVKGRFFERLREEGVEVHSFMPVHFPAFTSKVNYRNHRKICVIDGTVGFIGGMNIAYRYVKGWASRIRKKKNNKWRDTHLKLTGSVVAGLQRAFLVDWYFVDRTLITGREYYPNNSLTPSPRGEGSGQTSQMISQEENLSTPLSPWRGGGGEALMQVVTSSPTSPWPEIEQGYVRILLEARSYVYLETPYFLPTEPVLFAMRTAALAGVDVRLLIPMHIDAKLVEWASRSYVTEIVEAGVKVYLYQPGFNHSKLLVCDDFLASVGSTNVDFRSFDNNFEANVFIYDRELALRVKQVYLDDEAQSLLLDDEQNLEKRPFMQRLWESLVRLLSPLL